MLQPGAVPEAFRLAAQLAQLRALSMKLEAAQFLQPDRDFADVLLRTKDQLFRLNHTSLSLSMSTCFAVHGGYSACLQRRPLAILPGVGGPDVVITSPRAAQVSLLHSVSPLGLLARFACPIRESANNARCSALMCTAAHIHPQLFQRMLLISYGALCFYFQIAQ